MIHTVAVGMFCTIQYYSEVVFSTVKTHPDVCNVHVKKLIKHMMLS